MIHIHWFGVFCASISILAFFITFQKAKDLNLKKGRLYTFLALIAALPGASFAIYYAHLFSTPAWYYQFRSIVGIEFLLILIGIFGGMFASILPKFLRISPLLGVLAFSFVPFIKPVLGAIDNSKFKDKWDGDICLQSTPSTCGPASTATVLKSLGCETSESTLAKEAFSYNGGTEAWYLAKAVKKRDFHVDFTITEGFSPELGLPAVIGVRLGNIGHFIAILSKTGDTFHVGDPINCSKHLTLQELHQRYTFTGFHMHFRRKNEPLTTPPAL